MGSYTPPPPDGFLPVDYPQAQEGLEVLGAGGPIPQVRVSLLPGTTADAGDVETLDRDLLSIGHVFNDALHVYTHQIDTNGRTIYWLASVDGDTTLQVGRGTGEAGNSAMLTMGCNADGSGQKFYIFGDSVPGTGHGRLAAIANADGTLADLTLKFNTLLGALRGWGWIEL